MSQTQSLAVKTRAGLGKGACRKLRADDMVPGVYYDAKGVNVPVMVEHLPLQKLYSKIASSHVFDLQIEGETKPALVWKVEHHPTKPRITHVDFYGVDLTKEIQVRVPVEVVGKSKGQVKGGQLEIHREFIEVLCLPLVIPDKIVLDITNVDINESILIADVVLPEGVKAVYDNNYAVIGVLASAAEAAGEGA
ncbi:50S ribosomal protein L25/general stress protein Ctc [Solidesulfovibrio magneticus]|uniref:Large ribosomal subunit protein bL25 n=1 Tax=Solidesulfovibrio magneticus (strain ATCC 700980 / DSM 13731 / RS-1) TaxID=573370 RepID=RL25_SOLM1|nr:50S ribosomal protein L25/general stress protein Ctc [Solidesulfovibrio magneticus]C4XHR1.1 RecName: Full=Large ribosomal subunit protein bL25; AltName: Full=50S ribosomal protein L25; AltName: Full=General stress protein CTC [Solidesulfovibrio magneticus RS-1]BAH76435.1 50S ribosomal protein L25 [Solidesulfovibrio magneticus RS-1]